MIDRNELKRRAQAATPGPWEVHTTPKGPIVTSEDRQFEIAICGVDADVFSGKDFGQENAALIAAANPQAVLALIERCERAEALLNTREVTSCDTGAVLEAIRKEHAETSGSGFSPRLTLRNAKLWINELHAARGVLLREIDRLEAELIAAEVPDAKR